MKRIARAGRHLVLDLTPLRRSHDLRCLFAGQFASTLGTQLTTVAVPYQVYTLTHSSLDVGLVSLAQLLPLIAGALLGGALAEAADRFRRWCLLTRRSHRTGRSAAHPGALFSRPRSALAPGNSPATVVLMYMQTHISQLPFAGA